MNLETNFDDTIVAIATANGMGAISIVRLSGKDSLDISLRITKQASIAPRMATLSKLYDINNDLIDEALIIYFKNPSSFTGEDIVEFQCHGGFAVSSLILDCCVAYGARLANGGEFTKRAFLNNKLDLSQAQAIGKLIEAKSKASVKLLARQLKGELSHYVDEIKKDLTFILAYTEVTIDYATEDLPQDIVEQIYRKLIFIKTKLENTLRYSQQRDGLLDGFKVAIIGKPNVGKSSLLNKLLNFDRAIVSDIEGTTRDTVEENIKVGSHIIKIIDTAGIRESNDIVEQIGIKKSRQTIDDADILIALFDNSRKFDAQDKIIEEILTSNTKEQIRIITKIDLPNKLVTINNHNYIKLNTNNDISILLDTLENILNQNTSSHEMILISKQQIQHTTNTLNEINTSFGKLNDGELEFFSYHINEALIHISNITRPYEYDNMLDVMFGEFCLGK